MRRSKFEHMTLQRLYNISDISSIQIHESLTSKQRANTLRFSNAACIPSTLHCPGLNSLTGLHHLILHILHFTSLIFEISSRISAALTKPSSIFNHCRFTVFIFSVQAPPFLHVVLCYSRKSLKLQKRSSSDILSLLLMRTTTSQGNTLYDLRFIFTMLQAFDLSLLAFQLYKASGAYSPALQPTWSFKTRSKSCQFGWWESH